MSVSDLFEYSTFIFNFVFLSFSGLIMLVVTLIMFPLPLEQVMKFLKSGEGSQFGGIVVPCTELVVEGVWTKSL